jgi:hypothetical protein
MILFNINMNSQVKIMLLMTVRETQESEASMQPENLPLAACVLLNIQGYKFVANRMPLRSEPGIMKTLRVSMGKKLVLQATE